MSNKFKIMLILLLVLSFLITGTYCIFTYEYDYYGSVYSPEFSTTLLDNSSFLSKVQNIDSSITSIDKTTDLHRVTTVPTVSLTNENIVSTQSSGVPTFLWVDDGVLYYYTIAESIDINNN